MRGTRDKLNFRRKYIITSTVNKASVIRSFGQRCITFSLNCAEIVLQDRKSRDEMNF